MSEPRNHIFRKPISLTADEPLSWGLQSFHPAAGPFQRWGNVVNPIQNVGERHLGVRWDVDVRHLDAVSLGACRDVGRRQLGVHRNIDERHLDAASLGAHWDIGWRRLGIRWDVDERYLGTVILGACREIGKSGSWELDERCLSAALEPWSSSKRR